MGLGSYSESIDYGTLRLVRGEYENEMIWDLHADRLVDSSCGDVQRKSVRAI